MVHSNDSAAATEQPALMCASVQRTTYNSDVYEPSDDTFLLADALAQAAPAWRAAPPLTVLEVGCGSGFIICTAALLLSKHNIKSQLFATDISDAALRATHETLAAHGVSNVELVQASLMRSFMPQLANAIDLIIFNPPYVVTPTREVQQGGIAAAWAGGKDGRVVIDAFLQQAVKMLSPTGCAFLVTVAENRPLQICEQMRCNHQMHAEVVMERRADEELLSIIAFRHAA